MTTRTAPPLVVLADTRERTIPPFPDGVVVERRMLAEADYTTEALIDVARIERKSVCDLASTLSWGRERFDREVQRLQAYRWRCVVVEGDLTEVYRVTSMCRNAIIGSIASLYARSEVPTLFAGDAAGAGRLIAGILRRWEERIAAEAPSPTEPTPFAHVVDARVWLELGDVWRGIALLAAERARACWGRANETADIAEEGLRELGAIASENAAADSAVWRVVEPDVDERDREGGAA